MASVYLFKFLRGGGPDQQPYKLSSSEGSRLLRICLSMTAAWVIASSVAQIAVFRGQKAREAEREVQMAEGRVWTQGATLHNEMATIMRQVDALSPEEIIEKVRHSAASVQHAVLFCRILPQVHVRVWSAVSPLRPD